MKTAKLRFMRLRFKVVVCEECGVITSVTKKNKSYSPCPIDRG